MGRRAHTWNARGERKCAACARYEPPSEFYRRPSGQVDSYCLPCKRAQRRELRRARYRTDPVFRDECRAQNRVYYHRKADERRHERIWRVDQARHLIERAKAAGITQRALAAALGTRQTQISDWRTGRKRIGQRRLDDLRAAVRQMETQR